MFTELGHLPVSMGEGGERRGGRKGGLGGWGGERVTKYVHPDRHICSFRAAELNDLPKPIV